MAAQNLIADSKALKFLDYLFEDIVKPQLADGVIAAVVDVVSAAHTDDILGNPVSNHLARNENFELQNTNE